MKIFLNLVSATLKDMLRDKMSLFWFILFPVIFMFLFGWIFSGTGSPIHFDLGVVVEGETPLSAALVSSLNAVDVITLHQGTLDDEQDALAEGDRSAVIVLPKFQGEGSVTIPVYYNAAEQTNHILPLMLGEILNGVERMILRQPQMFVLDVQPIQSEPISDVDYLLPGILAMALMQLGLFGSMRLVYLREKRILRSLGATPLPRIQIVFSEIAVRLLIASVQALLIILIGYFVFDVRLAGSWWQIAAAVFFGAAVFVSIGYMLVSFARTEESANGILQIVQFPMMFLSGIFFPLELLPSVLQPVVKVIPLTYLGDLLRGVLVGIPYNYGPSVSLLVLGAWLIVSFSAAVRFWRWD